MHSLRHGRDLLAYTAQSLGEITSSWLLLQCLETVPAPSGSASSVLASFSDSRISFMGQKGILAAAHLELHFRGCKSRLTLIGLFCVEHSTLPCWKLGRNFIYFMVQDESESSSISRIEGVRLEFFLLELQGYNFVFICWVNLKKSFRLGLCAGWWSWW